MLNIYIVQVFIFCFGLIVGLLVGFRFTLFVNLLFVFISINVFMEILLDTRQVWRYQMRNEKPYTKEGQKIQKPNAEGQKIKLCSANHNKFCIFLIFQSNN